MDEPRLRIVVCPDFLPEVRAALPEHFRRDVEIRCAAAGCTSPEALCVIAAAAVADDTASAAVLGDRRRVDFTRAEDGADECALTCSDAAVFPLVNEGVAAELLAEGAYLVTPAWVRDWRARLAALGFDRQLAREYFAECCTRFVLLDTGLDERAADELPELGRYLDLPVRRLPCGLDYLRLFLTGLVLSWRGQHTRELGAEDDQRRREADYAMTLDTLGTLAGLTDEQEVAEGVLDLLTILFAPGRLQLLTLDDGLPRQLLSRPPAEEPEAVTARLAATTSAFALGADDSFVFRIGHDDAGAVIEAGAFTRPDRRDDYLNLALTLSGAFDLALANARSFARLERARRALSASESRYRALMDQARDAIVLVDESGTVLEANVEALALLGRPRHDVVGRALAELGGSTFAAEAGRAFAQLFREGTAAVPDLRLPGPQGRDTVVAATLTTVDVEGQRVAQGIFHDVTARDALAAQLRAMSLEDELTGLRNRRGFVTLAEQQLKAGLRLGRAQGLLYADVDGLKPVNDQQGHAAGDDLLCETADLLASCFRDMDILARMGGDEFAVLMIDAGVPELADAVRRLEGAQAAANGRPGRRYPLSFSVGTALFDPSAPRPLDELLHLADERMYSAKRTARRAGR